MPSPNMIPTRHVIPMYYPTHPSAIPPGSTQPYGGRNTSRPRGRSRRRDFAFGTPPDYVPRSPPQELIHRGRQRARSLSLASVGSYEDRERSYSPSRRPKPIDYAYVDPRTSNPHHDSLAHPRSNPHHNSPAHPRSEHHDHRRHHRHRSPMHFREPSPTRPTYPHRRSHSLPTQQAAYNNQGYYHPSTPAAPFYPTRAVMPTGTNMPAYGVQPTVVPIVESRHRSRNTGFFSRLFGTKSKNTHRSRSVQPYVGHGSSVPGVYGTQGNAFTQMYSPLPAPTFTIPRSTHRHRKRGRSH